MEQLSSKYLDDRNKGYYEILSESVNKIKSSLNNMRNVIVPEDDSIVEKKKKKKKKIFLLLFSNSNKYFFFFLVEVKIN